MKSIALLFALTSISSAYANVDTIKHINRMACLREGGAVAVDARGHFYCRGGRHSGLITQGPETIRHCQASDIGKACYMDFGNGSGAVGVCETEDESPVCVQIN